MTPLHVVHVVCTDAFAGVERYVLGSALSLRSAGCTVTVVGGAEPAMRDQLIPHGITWLPGSTIPRALRSLRRIPSPDVINTHMTLADVAGVVSSRRLGSPVVSTRHFAAARGSSPAARILTRHVTPRIATQIAISEFVSRNIEGESTVVYTGVADADAPREPRAPIVLLAQRLESEKATDVALRAWARIPDRGDWRLQIAGDGAEQEALVALAAELDIAGTVDFLGFQSDVDALFDRASLFFAPTPREGLGLSVIEAMAHGIPVIASRAGGHLESVGALPGAAMFSPGDDVEAAHQMARLMADAHARRWYGTLLQERQRAMFNLETQTEKTLRVLASVTGRGF